MPAALNLTHQAGPHVPHFNKHSWGPDYVPGTIRNTLHVNSFDLIFQTSL